MRADDPAAEHRVPRRPVDPAVADVYGAPQRLFRDPLDAPSHASWNDKIYTGTGRAARRASDHPPPDAGKAGWGFGCLPRLHERDVAFVATGSTTPPPPAAPLGLRPPVNPIATF
jgi:hypothetical protein